VKCRARLDWLHDEGDVILDYKTTDAKSPSVWIRQIANNGYDMQAAHYIDGVDSILDKVPDFIFMVQETEAPYSCYFVQLHPSYLEIGRQKMMIARERWKECLSNNQWPAYDNRIIEAEPPGWALVDIEEKMIEQQGWSKEAFLFGGVRREN